MNGKEEELLATCYDIAIEIQTMENPSSPSIFLKEVHSLLHKLDPKLMASMPPSILIGFQSKPSFVLAPSLLERLAKQNKEDLDIFFKTHFYEPARKLLDSPMPRQVLSKILQRCALYTHISEFLEEFENLSYKTIKDKLLEPCSLQGIRILEQIIENAFCAVLMQQPFLNLGDFTQGDDNVKLVAGFSFVQEGLNFFYKSQGCSKNLHSF